MSMGLSVLGLVLGIGLAAADTTYTMPSSRLELGRELSRDPATTTEAVVVLMQLLEEPSVAGEAGAALWAWTVGTPCRADWQTVRAALGKSPDLSHAQRDALRRHVASCPVAPVRAGAAEPPTQEQISLLGRARELLSAGRTEEAWPVALQVVQARPTDIEALWQLALSGLPTERDAEVLRMWRAGIESSAPGEARDQLVADLGVVHGIRGEWLKRRGDGAASVGAYSLAVAMRPDRSDLWAGLGGALWPVDRPAALQAYLESLVRDPTGGDPLAAAASLCLDSGDLESAAVLLAHAPVDSEAANAARARLRIAPVLGEIEAVASGSRDAGLPRLARIVVQNPTSAAVLEAVAYGQLRLGEPDAAVETFRRAAGVAADPFSARLGEGLATLAAGDTEGAEALLLQLESGTSQLLVHDSGPLRRAILRARAVAAAARGDRRAARDRFAALVGATPADTWSWLGLGELFLAEGEVEAALAYFDRAATLGQAGDVSGKCAALKGSLRAKVALGQAPEEAAMAGRMCPGAADGWLAVGEAALQTGDVSLAQRAAGRATALDPASVDVRALECRVIAARGEVEVAFRCASRLLSTSPRSEGAAMALAESASGPVQLVQAAAILGEAAAVGGSPAVAERAEAMALAAVLARARLLAEDGDPGAAVALLGDATAQAQSDPASQLAIAAVLMEMGATAKAQGVYRDVLAALPDSTDARIGLARVQQAEGRPAAALRALQEHIDADPSPALLLAAAEVALDLGDRARARTLLAQAKSHSAPRLELVALPDGSLPPTTGSLRPARGSFAALLASETPSSDWRSAKVDELRARLDARALASSTATVLGLHQSGSLGEGWMAAAGAHVSTGRLSLGLFSAQVDAMPLWVSDGASEGTGVALLAGVGWRGGRFGAEGSVGSSPIGFQTTPYLVAHARGEVRWSAATLGIGGARVPVTDSVASWAGAWDERVADFGGQAAYSWLGADFSARGAGALSASGSFRGGELRWLGDHSVARSDAMLSADRRFDGQDMTLRLGPALAWTAHARGEAAFDAQGSGAFVPESDLVALLRLDAASPPSSGTRFCGQAAAGVESVVGLPGTADARDGTRLSLALAGGVMIPSQSRSAVRVSGSWRTSGFEWYQMGLAVTWIARVAPNGGALAPPPEPLGGLVARAYDCAL